MQNNFQDFKTEFDSFIDSLPKKQYTPNWGAKFRDHILEKLKKATDNKNTKEWIDKFHGKYMKEWDMQVMLCFNTFINCCYLLIYR